MKTYVLVYDGFVHFEVTLTCMFMKTQGDVITVAVEDKLVTSNEGFVIKPHMLLKDMNTEEADLFVIPGGQHMNVYGNPVLTEKLNELNGKGKLIAAICSAPVHLAKAGILNGKKYTSYPLQGHENDFRGALFQNQNVVIDGNLVTAKAVGYVDMALEIGKIMKIYKDEKDMQETVDFYRHFVDVAY